MRACGGSPLTVILSTPTVRSIHGSIPGSNITTIDNAPAIPCCMQSHAILGTDVFTCRLMQMHRLTTHRTPELSVRGTRGRAARRAPAREDPPRASGHTRLAASGGDGRCVTATCVQCAGLPPAARVLHPPLSPPLLLFPCRDNDTAGAGASPPRRGGIGQATEPSSQMPLALLMPVSLAGRDPPVEIPPSPDAPSVAHQRAWHALGGSGAAVLQPSTTARARSPLQCAAPHAPHQLLIS